MESKLYVIIFLFVFLLSVIKIAGLPVIPDALALHGSAILLPVPSFDERLTASLAERNIGFTAVVIQSVGIHRHKSGKTEIGCVHHGFDGGLQLDLPGGEVIFQAHIQFWYLVNKPL